MLSIPNNLTVENAGKWKMSIRISSDGLSFSGYIPSENNSFFYSTAPLNSENLRLNELKKNFEDSDFLKWEYLSSTIVFSSLRYTLLPDELFQIEKKNEAYNFVFENTCERVCSSELKMIPAHVIFGVGKEEFDFLVHQCPRAEMTHSVALQLKLQAKQSLQYHFPQMYVVEQCYGIDISCFNKGKLLFANSFSANSEENKLYHILNIWQTQNLSQLRDLVFICGNNKELSKQIEIYIPHVRRIELPTNAFLQGTALLNAPLDIISNSILHENN